jgi:hypothetical protein
MLLEGAPPRSSLLSAKFDASAFDCAFELLPRLHQEAACWAWTNHFQQLAASLSFLLDAPACTANCSACTAASTSDGTQADSEEEGPSTICCSHAVLQEVLEFLCANEMWCTVAFLLPSCIK